MSDTDPTSEVVDPHDPDFSNPDVDPEGFPEHGDGEATADEEAAEASGEEE